MEQGYGYVEEQELVLTNGYLGYKKGTSCRFPTIGEMTQFHLLHESTMTESILIVLDNQVRRVLKDLVKWAPVPKIIQPLTVRLDPNVTKKLQNVAKKCKVTPDDLLSQILADDDYLFLALDNWEGE